MFAYNDPLSLLLDDHHIRNVCVRTPLHSTSYKFTCLLNPFCLCSCRNKLDSLLKVSKLKAEEIVKLNEEYCANIEGNTETQIGGRTALGKPISMSNRIFWIGVYSDYARYSCACSPMMITSSAIYLRPQFTCVPCQKRISQSHIACGSGCGIFAAA